MKKLIKESLKQLVADRYLLILVALMLLLVVGVSISIGLSIHPSERQLVSHYSAFGITHFYFDQWFYSLVFIAFELIVAILHSVISVKLLITKGHPIAIMFAWLGIGIILVGYIITSTILGLQTLL
jgi:sensor domain CHASE-containing protein